MRGIAKGFPGVVALDGVDLEVGHGEVVLVTKASLRGWFWFPPLAESPVGASDWPHPSAVAVRIAASAMACFRMESPFHLLSRPSAPWYRIHLEFSSPAFSAAGLPPYGGPWQHH